MAASRRRMFKLAGSSGIAALLSGCAAPERGVPVPEASAAAATVLGVANERFFPSLNTEPIRDELLAAVMRTPNFQGIESNALLPQLEMLALSGGGENGAFGAGLLCGWTALGTRPEFNMVTGVSTGALIAPFAFLGSRYDEQLRAVFTGLSPDELLKSRPYTAALFDDGMIDNAPLFLTISRYINEAMLAEIAAGYDSGRVLFISTTNLDAQLPVLWNIGAIAKSGHPRALDTVRRVMLASAAIPGAFPPTMFDVTLDGHAYQEMHVDGGTFAQAFLYPSAAVQNRRDRIARHQPVRPMAGYIIRNGRLDPEWADVKRRTINIAGRAISTMIAASGYNDVARIYNTTRRDNVAFNLAYIGPDFKEVLPQPFDPKFMRALFDYGYQKALHGYEWASKPPF